MPYFVLGIGIFFAMILSWQDIQDRYVSLWLLMGFITSALLQSMLQRQIIFGVFGGLGLTIILGSVKCLAEYLLKKPALGVGDLYFVGGIGLFLGFRLGLLALYFASIFAGVWATAVMISRLRFRNDVQIPMIPFLLFGFVTAKLWGDVYLEWIFDATARILPS